MELYFANERAQRRGAPQAPQPGDREFHPSILMIRGGNEAIFMIAVAGETLALRSRLFHPITQRSHVGAGSVRACFFCYTKSEESLAGALARAAAG